HHLQIVSQDYMTEEREVEIKGGEVASQGTIALRARMPAQPAATPNVVQQSTQKESKQKVATTPKVATRNKQPAAAPATVTHQAATTSPPPMKVISKPAASPQQKPQRPFEGGVPGG